MRAKLRAPKQRRCPLSTCRNLVIVGQVMCRNCWGKVPQDLQRRVWAEKEVVQRVGTMTGEYRDAIREAMESVRYIQPRLPYKDN